MGCDICGKMKEADFLRDSLVTPKFSHICSSCNKEYMKRKFDFCDAFPGKIVLEAMQAEKCGPSKLAWWENSLEPRKETWPLP